MKPYYSPDCAAKTQVQGQALSSSPVANNSNNAWIVNFNNGNDNNNNKNNNNYVRLVRSSECLAVVVPPSVCFFNDESPSFTNGGSGRILSYRALYNAFIQAKKRKKPSYNRLMFEQDWLSHLFTILTKLQQHTWQPLPSVCFVAKRPKAREIHAPDFADRVVHHWLVPHLEAIYEPIFIYDSFANRKGKGTHAAVERLQQFVRQVYSGQGKGRGYYLQLDIHNFFNSIHRPTLYGLLKAKVQSVSPFLKGGLRGIYGQKNPPQPSFEKGGSFIANKTTERLPLSQRGTKGDLWAKQIHPNPPLPKEGASSLTKQQSVLPFAKGGIYSPFYLINPKETP
ncbi:MAG: hypothetical protein KDI39_17995 [Pseudomonadales bacterium]|nr:hypothetical protein [Pseudomonadales bacterium]